ncbi:hypothetical protein FJY94_02715 [Candidatus Kaiserbacteria bacterium]|nr:hypothetical protein [Candidatus Kaiserbacteria bacterium]
MSFESSAKPRNQQESLTGPAAVEAHIRDLAGEITELLPTLSTEKRGMVRERCVQAVREVREFFESNALNDDVTAWFGTVARWAAKGTAGVDLSGDGSWSNADAVDTAIGRGVQTLLLCIKWIDIKHASRNAGDGT